MEGNLLASEIKQKIQNNAGVLLVILSRAGCQICDDFKFIVSEIQPDHDKYLSVVGIDTADIDGLDIVPHLMYPMNYFYVKNEPRPFIRAGLVHGELLDKELSKFKRVLEGEDPNLVFSG